MGKLLLVDGSNLLFQMFYGMPARIVSSEGKPIHGTLGFVGALLKIIRMIRPTHVAVLFDGEHENSRKALDADYKADREDYSNLPEEEIPFSQLPDIYRALDHMGIPYAETVDCEADDWIAAYALRFGGAWEIVIASMDSDFFQLISESVRVLRYRGSGSVLCDAAYLWEKLGVAPEQYAEHKSLTGDHADNIPGVPGVGPKTAAMLLREFGSLETILADPSRIKRSSIRDSIAARTDRIRMNYRLIRLDSSAEIPMPPESLAWQDTGFMTTEVLRRIGLR